MRSPNDSYGDNNDDDDDDERRNGLVNRLLGPRYGKA